MKKLMLIVFSLFSVAAYGQKEIHFSVEELSKPKELLRTQTYTAICERLILSDVDMFPVEIERDSIDFPFRIIAKSNAPDSLVSYGYHSFFSGMYQAYAEHRPFVLSPDMIWLLVSQGFARHVNANPEKLRYHFVNFSGKLSLAVPTKEVTLDNPNSAWEKVFPEFTKQIGEYAGSELVSILSSDFSTTTPTTKIASEITIMKAMEPYFEFVLFYAVCGIPEITLQGTTDDWQKVLDKTKQLSKYDLGWWTKELIPILEELVNTSKGDINKRFWRNMFKYHSKKKYGAPKIIDGWIVKFFPYDKDGKRNNLKELKGDGNLPEEIVKVDLQYVDEQLKATPLELWAGFIGLEQNNESYALTPKIGWMIREKDVENRGLKQKFEANSSWISIRVKEIPTTILELKEVRTLDVAFTDSILIPDRLAEVKISHLSLTGKIDELGIERICKLFPNTEVVVNRKSVNKANDLQLMEEILGIKNMPIKKEK